MIRVHGLTKEFDDFNGVFRALDNVSFEVQPGEIYGLLGPNGAGKTTCLRILSTVLRPTRGFAEVAGINVMHDAEAVRRNIGFMSCNTGIYDRMTAREMVEYFGRLYGIPEEQLQLRIEEHFEILQMNDELRELVANQASTALVRAEARSHGMRTLRESGLMALYEGQTTIDEVVRETILDD